MLAQEINVDEVQAEFHAIFNSLAGEVISVEDNPTGGLNIEVNTRHALLVLSIALSKYSSGKASVFHDNEYHDVGPTVFYIHCQ